MMVMDSSLTRSEKAGHPVVVTVKKKTKLIRGLRMEVVQQVTTLKQCRLV